MMKTPTANTTAHQNLKDSTHATDRSWHSIGTAIAIVAAAFALSACKGEAPAAAAPKPQASAAQDALVVTPPAELQARLKITALESKPLAQTLRVAGRLDFNEQQLARIGATVTGRVTEIHAHLGQQVRPGEPLAMLNSTELGNAQLAFLKASARAELEHSNVERAKQLYAADVIGRAELQRRENEAGVAMAEKRATEDQLRVLGMSAKGIGQLARSGAINSLTPVVATLNGTVVERKVTQGQVVEPALAMFTVADLSRLWAVAEVPEQQAALVRVGQSVHIEVPALGDEVFTGKLIYISDTLNPETRTVLVRTELNNPEHRLKPAMLATMLIAGKATDRLAIPAAAVVRENNIDHVFVPTSNGSYRLQPVILESESDGQRPVRSGLKAGDSVVVEGAFHLNNERKRKELEGS